MLLRLGAGLAPGHGAGGDAAIGFLRQRQHGGRVHVARHHHGGVGGHIPALAEGAHVIGRHGIQIAHPANHGPVIGRGHEGGGHLLLIKPRAGLVVGAQAALFLDHGHLAREFVVRPLVVFKAVGLQRHHLRQRGGGHLLEIRRVVGGGEGVVAPAQQRHAARDFAGA